MYYLCLFYNDNNFEFRVLSFACIMIILLPLLFQDCPVRIENSMWMDAFTGLSSYSEGGCGSPSHLTIGITAGSNKLSVC